VLARLAISGISYVARGGVGGRLFGSSLGTFMLLPNPPTASMAFALMQRRRRPRRID